MGATHWLTCYDPDDGEPYGIGCDCEIGDDHDGTGELTFAETADGIALDGSADAETSFRGVRKGGAGT
jgi:hypothetical protein